jgi:lysophospholipase L1-like esterase
MPASPFPFYDHADVEFGGQGFSGLFVRGRHRRRAIYGLAGFALEARAGAVARLRDRHAFTRVALHYLMQPGGGQLSGERRGAAPWRIATAGALEVRHAERPVTPCHGLRLRVEAGAVRVFGVTLENESGVVVDAFGVPGARVWDQEPWRLNVLRHEALARPASLLVFAYGTNESANARVPLADVERRGARALRRLRSLYAGASCLLVGPGDWPRRNRHGILVPRPRLLAVRRVQRHVAREQGCAFFDTYAFMGGEGSMVRWMADGLALGDHAHFTSAGSRRLGRALYRTLTPGESE